MNELVIRDIVISEDRAGFVNLTDIWHLAGAPSTKTTSNWRQLPTSHEFIVAVAQNLGKSYVSGKNDANSVLYTRSGRGGGTFAHILVAIAYAEYLSPELAVDVKQTYVRVRTGDVTLVDEILAKAEAARHHGEVRDVSKQVRRHYTDVLTSHGAGGSAIAFCTDAIYQVLLGGSAKQVIASRGLPAKTNLRNTLDTGDLLQTLNTEYLSAERIEALNVRGKNGCADASAQVAHYVKGVFTKVRDPKPLS